MKREILCPPCADSTAKAITGLKYIDGRWIDPYPGESKKFVTGILIRHCNCDACNKDLIPGSKAVALSIWTTSQGYFPWEFDFFECEESELCQIRIWLLSVDTMVTSNQTSMSGITSPEHQGQINS